MNNEFSLKELYDVRLKATYNIEVGNHTIEPGETIALFDKILISNFNEINEAVAARGGYGNIGHVWWETTKEVDIQFSQGIFSKEQLALLTNSKLCDYSDYEALLTNRELIESNESGLITLKETPVQNLYIYDMETGDKVTNYTINENIITVTDTFKDYIIDYQYLYSNDIYSINIGQKLINGFVSLEGRTRIKEDITGQVRTGIISIPKLRLMSNLSMRLGRDAIPQVGGFSAIAVPHGPRGQQIVMGLHLLEDDIDSDI